MNYETFKAAVGFSGLSTREFTCHHYQIIGHKQKVNVWPMRGNDRSVKFLEEKSPKGKKAVIGSIDQAVELAGRTPPVAPAAAPVTGPPRRTWLEIDRRGKNNFAILSDRDHITQLTFEEMLGIVISVFRRPGECMEAESFFARERAHRDRNGAVRVADESDIPC